MSRGRQTLFDILGSRGGEAPPPARKGTKASKSTRKRAPAASQPAEGEILITLRSLLVCGALLLVVGGVLGYGLGRPSTDGPALETRQGRSTYVVQVWSSPEFARADSPDGERWRNAAFSHQEHLKEHNRFPEVQVRFGPGRRSYTVTVGKEHSRQKAEDLLSQLREVRGPGGNFYQFAITKELPK